MGFLIAIFNSFTVASQDVFVKKLQGEKKVFLIWLRMVAALPVLAILVSIFSSWKFPAATFWWIILCINVPIELIQFYAGYTALQISPISLVAPLSSFTSIFLIPVSYLVLGEIPSLIALVGVLLVVIGTFFLGWEWGNRSLLRMVKNIFAERGSYLVLLSAFLVSISITTTKFAFRYAPPLLTAFYIVAGITLLSFPLVLFWKEKHKVEIPRRPILLGGLSLMSGLSLALHNVGISLLPLAYYISVKRLSMVWNVVFGKVIFEEKNIRERLIGVTMMLGGIVLIGLG